MPLEIERRFLIRPEAVPPDSDWPVFFYEDVILQIYLLSQDGGSERIRARRGRAAGWMTLTHTKKTTPPGAPVGVHEEQERVVTWDEYHQLLTHKDPSCVAVTKVRRVFTWPKQGGRVFELDLFEFPFDGLVILEVELPTIDALVELPPFLGELREVTEDRRYSNAALARRGHAP